MDFTYGFGLGNGDNGNVLSIANNRDNTRSQSFTYDALNRITTAQTNSTSGTKCWGENFGIDGWGNFLTLSGLSGYSACTQESGFGVGANAQNQVSMNAYDAAGNMTTGGYVYDAENHLLSGGGVTYTYDGYGKRVEKSNGKIYWYGMGSSVLDETDLTGSTTNTGFHEYIFFNEKRTARRDSSNSVFYYFADQLGTSRTIVQSGQTTPCYDADFYPFGGERSPIINNCPQNYKFAGKERDSESGLDDVGARFYASSSGRFISPDQGAPNFVNPQSLNRYRYALNNPLRYVDVGGFYEQDVHKDLTRVLALAAGYKEAEAQRISDADQGVDDSQVTGPFVSEQARANYHFTTAQRRSDLWSIAATSGSLEALGTYFHAEQDSFSHADYGPTYGHLFAGHGPDKTYNDPEKADTMANDTYNRLIQSFAFSCYVTNDSIGWALIRPFVQRFNRARTDQAKDVALNDLRTFIHNEQEKRKRISSAADEDGAARSCRLGNPAACDAHDQGQAQGETH